MTSQEDVNVTVKIGADLSGGVQSREELEKVRAQAKKMGADTAGSAAKAAHGMQGLEKSVGLVRKVLSGFGVGALFLSAVAGVEKIIESFGRAEQKAKDMKKAADDKAFAKSISDLADSYAKLNAQLSAAEQKENNVLEIIDMEVKARRELQEANLAAAEEKEIAGVDANAEDAEEQKRVIREKYAHIRSTRTASDKVEDLVLQRQKYDTQAKNDDKAAEAKEKEADDLERKARQVKSKAENEGINAVAPNEKDKSGVAKYFVEGFREFFTGDWGRMGSWQTDAGDAERDKHKANQEALEKQAEELQKQADAARNDAAAKRESASQNRRRMEAMNGSVEAAQIAQWTTQVKSDTAERDAAGALQKKRDEKAKEKAKADDVQKAYALLQRQKAEIEDKIAERESEKAAMGKYVADAEGDYETAKRNGNKREQESTYEKLQQLKQTAQNVEHEADKEINALNETLKNVVRVMQAARSELEKTKKQTLVQQAEAISGD